MGIFSRRKKSDEEDLEDKEGNLLEKEGQEGKKLKARKVKDLNPENKRRRKEPIRAWNKFDRIMLLIILILTAGAAFFLALSSRGYKLPKLPRITVPKLNLFGERTIVLESSDIEKKKAKKIIDDFNLLTKSLSGVYGLYVLDLESNYSFGVYENEKFQAASLIKLPVMAAMYLEEEGGRLDLDTKYKLKADDRVKGSGSLYGKPVGYELTYREMIRLMGKESDNTAFNICRKYLGDKKIGEIITQIGMLDTNLQVNETTPFDIGLFFKKLWEGKLINNENREEILGYLTDTIYEKWLTAGVPEGIRVAHKYGREIKVLNDGGIIYANNPYIAVIMGKDIVDEEVDKAFPELSGIIYKGMVGENGNR